MKRGFLDVTIRISPAYEIRLVGAHLKSKVASPHEDDALMRRHEAFLLRQHIDEILAAKPNTRLLVYGDFNDTRDQPAIREIIGTRGGANYLTDLQPRDAVGDRWTEYWPVEDVYSRIDYFFANAALVHEIVAGKSTIDRSQSWHAASDHRAICTVIQPRAL